LNAKWAIFQLIHGEFTFDEMMIIVVRFALDQHA